MLPFPSPGDPPDPGIEAGFPALKADSLPSEPPDFCSYYLFLSYYFGFSLFFLFPKVEACITHLKSFFLFPSTYILNAVNFSLNTTSSVSHKF